MDEAEPASLLCRAHGGRLPDERRAAAERVELAKLTVLNTLVLAVEEAAGVYLEIMRDQGEKASDRIKAADRVLEMTGLRAGQPLVQVQINTGLRPAEDARDARLVDIIRRLDSQRAELLQRTAIEAVARNAG